MTVTIGTIIRILIIIVALTLLSFDLWRRKFRNNHRTLAIPHSRLRTPGEISDAWRKFGSVEKEPGRRAYYKGMSALWSHEDEDIKASVRFFEEALKHPITDIDRRTVKLHLAIAYLNNEELYKAQQLIDELGFEDERYALTRALFYILQREMDEARSALSNAQHSSDIETFRSIIAFHYGSKEMCVALENLSEGVPLDLWVYGPAIGWWYWDCKRYGLYMDPSRFSLMAQHGHVLLQKLEREPAIFQSTSVRFFKTSLQALVGKVDSYDKFISICPITNMSDEITGTQVLPDEVKYEIAEYWRQAYYIYNRIQGVAPLEEQWNYLNDILGGETERVVGGHRNRTFELLVPKKSLPYALACQVRLTPGNDQILNCQLVDISVSQRMRRELQPLLRLIDESSGTTSLDFLLYKKLFENDTISKQSLREFAATLPNPLSLAIADDQFVRQFVSEDTP